MSITKQYVQKLSDYIAKGNLSENIAEYVGRHTLKDGKFIDPEDLPKGFYNLSKRFWSIHTERIGSVREGYIDGVKFESISTPQHQMFCAIYIGSDVLLWDTNFGVFIKLGAADEYVSEQRKNAYRSLRTASQNAKDKIVNQMASMLTFVRHQCDQSFADMVAESTKIQNYGFGSDK